MDLQITSQVKGLLLLLCNSGFAVSDLLKGSNIGYTSDMFMFSSKKSFFAF